MIPKLNQQEDILNRLVLHSLDNPNNLGLFHGQTGYMLVLAEYAQKYNNRYVEAIADVLCERIIQNAGKTRNISFANGLSGICWGIELLVQKGILDGTADECCSDVDSEIIKTDISRLNDFSLETGLGGLWQYVWARIQGNYVANLKSPFDDTYLEKWIDVLAKASTHFPPNSEKQLLTYLNGELNTTCLSLRQFVQDSPITPDKDLSLVNGLSGYIVQNYLNN